MENIETKTEFFANLNKCTTDDGTASELVVAVMTVCGSLGTEINLLEIFDYYMEEGYGLFEVSYVPNSKKNRDTIKNKAFYNCLNVTFYYEDSDKIVSKIASKIFPNGSIQIPGCRTIDSVREAPVIIYNFIKDISNKCTIKNPDINIIKNLDDFKLKNIRIVMINSNFVFKRGILQERLKNIINANKFDGNSGMWRGARFQPEKYSGCNICYLTNQCRETNKEIFLKGDKIPIKLEGQVSVFVFRSGKGTITGAKNTKDLLEAYEAIINLVRNNKTELFYDLYRHKKNILAVDTTNALNTMEIE